MTRDTLGRRGVLRAFGGIGSALVTGSSAAAVGAAQREADRTAATRRVQDQQDGAEGEGGREYTAVYEEAIDDVVLIRVFGGGPQSPGGLGSGFVIDADEGYLVTNNHVVSGASEVEVQFRDEQWRTASIVGTDIHSDLAVLSVDDLPDIVDGLSFADDGPVIGEEVVALGNPLGLDASISQGIVSGVDRSLPSPTGFSIPAAIQTDAPVNPGNSGGPLVDLDGNVLGVVFAGAGQAIGFAISAALAERVVPSLIENGEYEHAYMGVGVLPVGPLVAEVNDLERPRGVLVTEVVPDSPADGVLEPADGEEVVDGQPVPTGGDVIISIGDHEISNQDRLSSVLALETSPGETIDVEVIRDGERRTVELTLEARPETELP
ncbi:S1C family serine protease [Halosolutus gelatinilyticus]|uniref:S1C family serine protease n=1 Tax=Halosolutus gelatinilyticus TaxID=2931975 RepID=UPI001FF2AF55|nr:trypsin-like peptidase domain-containing protein [Halosolutus gelatinilyticus]